MGASSPQTRWAKCHRWPPELPPGPASLLLAVLRRLCAAEPWLCHVAPAPRHGQTLVGGAQVLPSLLLPPLPLEVPVPFSFLSPLPLPLSSPFLCPCPALCAGAGSLSFAPLTARMSQLSPRCWHCQPSPGPGRGCRGSQRQSLGGHGGNQEGWGRLSARGRRVGCDQTSVGQSRWWWLRLRWRAGPAVPSWGWQRPSCTRPAAAARLVSAGSCNELCFLPSLLSLLLCQTMPLCTWRTKPMLKLPSKT